MDNYAIETNIVDVFILHPSHMTSRIDSELEQIVVEKYKTVPMIVQHGFVFNVRNAARKANWISNTGQCRVDISFVADVYVPNIGDVFENRLQKTCGDQYWICVLPPSNIDVSPLKIFVSPKKTACENDIIKVVLTKVDKVFICFGKQID